MLKDKLKAICRYCFKPIVLDPPTIDGRRCPRCKGPLRTAESLTTDFLWSRDINQNLRRDRYPRDPNKYWLHTGKNDLKIQDIKTPKTREKQGAPLNLKVNAWSNGPAIERDIRKYMKPPRPRVHKRRLRGPSPYPCPYDDHIPDVDLSNHYSGWKRCSYRGHYFKKPRNKRGLKYCTGYYVTPEGKKRPYNCRAVNEWKREHPPKEYMEHPQGRGGLTLDRWIRGAFGKKITLPGQPPRYRAEYIDRVELDQFRWYCKELLKQEHQDAGDPSPQDQHRPEAGRWCPACPEKPFRAGRMEPFKAPSKGWNLWDLIEDYELKYGVAYGNKKPFIRPKKIKSEKTVFQEAREPERSGACVKSLTIEG